MILIFKINNIIELNNDNNDNNISKINKLKIFLSLYYTIMEKKKKKKR